MAQKKLSKKKTLSGEITLQQLKDKIYDECYSKEDSWYDDWTKTEGKPPSGMYCRWHDEDMYHMYETRLLQELRKYPKLHKQYDLEKVEHSLNIEIGLLEFQGKTKKEIEQDDKICAIRKKINKIKATDYEKKDKSYAVEK